MFIAVTEEIPTEFEVIGSGDAFAVITPLATSEDGWRLVGVETRLLPYQDGEEDWCELKFSIVVLDDEIGEPFRIFDRDMAKGYLPNEVRQFVMPCVIASIRALVETVQPRSIYRVTHSIRPSEKALHKHEMITDTLLSLGYEQHSGTDPFDRRFWEMRKEGVEDG